MKNTNFMKRLLICFALIFVILCPVCRGSAETVYAQAESVKLPVLMYHSILPNGMNRRSYTIPFSSLVSDLDYIESEGYTTILPGDLLKFINENVSLPKKPILLTFDDGFYNNLSLAAKELNRRGMKGSFAVVGSFTEKHAEENEKYGYLSLDNIKKLQDMGHEICNHSFAMHEKSPRKGMLPKQNESEKEYERSVKEDVKTWNEKLIAHGIRKPSALMYPFGSKTKKTDAFMKDAGFDMTFICYEIVNTITKDPACLFSLGRYNRDQKSAEEILRKIKI